MINQPENHEGMGMSAPKMEGAQVKGATHEIEQEIAKLLGADGNLAQ